MAARRPTLVLLPVLAALMIVALVAAAARSPVHPVPPAPQAEELTAARSVVADVNQLFLQRWTEAGVSPAERADELTILRRLSLALHGTIPSLEEVRRFEADAQSDRIERWTIQLLNDRRFADYFAARLARGFIGAEQGQFILFRRDRFTTWLSEQLQADRPLDEVVRLMIAEQGLWTGEPATNYITQAANDGAIDANKLAGRTVRAFLGQRIDCAQCHNHPFAHWKQGEFEGLAACFGQTKITATGIDDYAADIFEVEDLMTQEKRTVAPVVPFGAEWWPTDGTLRQRLAAWITHPDNRRFERAIANRAWAMMFGKPWHAPVDDLPDPGDKSDRERDLLDLLGGEFRANDCNLKRLLFTIATSRPFQLASQHPAYDTGEQLDAVESEYAVFPLVRLRPEQMIGAMAQASSIKTIDQNSHLFTRFLRFIRENDFVRDYGDLGEHELEDHPGTIPQALLRLNGRFAREVADGNPFNASGRIAGMAPTDADAIDISYLCCLARHPTAEERDFFLQEMTGPNGRERSPVVEDLYWTLFNSPEFCWNH
ncbi:MAG: DUF1549 domain-containing protein [Planctomycetaceae bacterium]|nr:DUF1549 domain-containing protein [Planctomycetaceae bacterium]